MKNKISMWLSLLFLIVALVTPQFANAGTSGNASLPLLNFNEQYKNKTFVDDESAREDKTTGGRIERSELQAGNLDIRITVDVPSFLLTLWQSGREVAVYHVGVGQKDFPIIIGERTAEQIILNPDWIPPDSEWVRESNIKPFERITAKDPRNPLGKIKIPLGSGYLLHEAKGLSDLGNLVSHGCVRILRTNLFDLSKKIARAYDLPIASIDKSRLDKTQRVINLTEPIEVDINYDTIVVENGMLHIYPDVYERNTNTIENLRAELQSNGVNDSKLSDTTLKRMLARATNKRQFVVALSDVRAGRALLKGKIEPVVNGQSLLKRNGSARRVS